MKNLYTLLLIVLSISLFSQNLSQFTISELEQKKAEAIANENYELAAKIKAEIKKKESQTLDKADLEKELQKAIDAEDYEKAAEIKEKIKKLNRLEIIDEEIKTAINNEDYNKAAELKEEKQKLQNPQINTAEENNNIETKPEHIAQEENSKQNIYNEPVYEENESKNSIYSTDPDEAERDFFISIGYRNGLGSLGSSGFGLEWGRQFELGSFADNALSLGLDVTFVGLDLVFLNDHFLSSTYTDKGYLLALGPQIGVFFSLNIPNTKLHFDIIYKLGANLISYSYQYETVDQLFSVETSVSPAFALRSNFGVNIRYGGTYIHIGYALGNTFEADIRTETKSTEINEWGNNNYTTNITETPGKVGTSMFELSIGRMF